MLRDGAIVLQLVVFTSILTAWLELCFLPSAHFDGLHTPMGCRKKFGPKIVAFSRWICYTVTIRLNDHAGKLLRLPYCLPAEDTYSHALHCTL